MQLSFAFLISAFASIAIAQNPFAYNPGELTSITAGSSFMIKWAPSTGTTDTITILLRQGDPSKLTTVLTIAPNITNTGNYLWVVPSTLVQGTNYTFEIFDDGNKDLANYSNQFTILSTNTASAVPAAASTTTTAATTATGKTTAAVARTGTSTTANANAGTTASATASDSGSATATASSSSSASASATKNAGSEGIRKVKVGGAMLGVVAGVFMAAF